jgi:hypothetical protein
VVASKEAEAQATGAREAMLQAESSAKQNEEMMEKAKAEASEAQVAKSKIEEYLPKARAAAKELQDEVDAAKGDEGSAYPAVQARLEASAEAKKQGDDLDRLQELASKRMEEESAWLKKVSESESAKSRIDEEIDYRLKEEGALALGANQAAKELLVAQKKMAETQSANQNATDACKDALAAENDALRLLAELLKENRFQRTKAEEQAATQASMLVQKFEDLVALVQQDAEKAVEEADAIDAAHEQAEKDARDYSEKMISLRVLAGSQAREKASLEQEVAELQKNATTSATAAEQAGLAEFKANVQSGILAALQAKAAEAHKSSPEEQLAAVPDGSAAHKEAEKEASKATEAKKLAIGVATEDQAALQKKKARLATAVTAANSTARQIAHGENAKAHVDRGTNPSRKAAKSSALAWDSLRTQGVQMLDKLRAAMAVAIDAASAAVMELEQAEQESSSLDDKLRQRQKDLQRVTSETTELQKLVVMQTEVVKKSEALAKSSEQEKFTEQGDADTKAVEQARVDAIAQTALSQQRAYETSAKSAEDHAAWAESAALKQREKLEAPVTNLAMDANKVGLSTVKVLSATGFGVGDIVLVGTADAFEKRTLAGVGSRDGALHFTAPLGKKYAAGTAVKLEARALQLAAQQLDGIEKEDADKMAAAAAAKQLGDKVAAAKRASAAATLRAEAAMKNVYNKKMEAAQKVDKLKDDLAAKLKLTQVKSATAKTALQAATAAAAQSGHQDVLKAAMEMAAAEVHMLKKMWIMHGADAVMKDAVAVEQLSLQKAGTMLKEALVHESLAKKAQDKANEYADEAATAANMTKMLAVDNAAATAEALKLANEKIKTQKGDYEARAASEGAAAEAARKAEASSALAAADKMEADKQAAANNSVVDALRVQAATSLTVVQTVAAKLQSVTSDKKTASEEVVKAQAAQKAAQDPVKAQAAETALLQRAAQNPADVLAAETALLKALETVRTISEEEERLVAEQQQKTGEQAELEDKMTKAVALAKKAEEVAKQTAAVSKAKSSVAYEEAQELAYAKEKAAETMASAGKAEVDAKNNAAVKAVADHAAEAEAAATANLKHDKSEAAKQAASVAVAKKASGGC